CALPISLTADHSLHFRSQLGLTMLAEKFSEPVADHPPWRSAGEVDGTIFRRLHATPRLPIERQYQILTIGFLQNVLSGIHGMDDQVARIRKPLDDIFIALSGLQEIAFAFPELPLPHANLRSDVCALLKVAKQSVPD